MSGLGRGSRGRRGRGQSALTRGPGATRKRPRQGKKAPDLELTDLERVQELQNQRSRSIEVNYYLLEYPLIDTVLIACSIDVVGNKWKMNLHTLDQYCSCILQTAMSSMSREQIENMLRLTLEKQPGLMFDVWDEVYQAGNPNQEPEPGRPQTTPSWCKCLNCREMPTDLERLCCGLKPENCVSTAPVSCSFCSV